MNTLCFSAEWEFKRRYARARQRARQKILLSREFRIDGKYDISHAGEREKDAGLNIEMRHQDR